MPGVKKAIRKRITGQTNINQAAAIAAFFIARFSTDFQQPPRIESKYPSKLPTDLFLEAA